LSDVGMLLCLELGNCLMWKAVSARFQQCAYLLATLYGVPTTPTKQQHLDLCHFVWQLAVKFTSIHLNVQKLQHGRQSNMVLRCSAS